MRLLVVCCSLFLLWGCSDSKNSPRPIPKIDAYVEVGQGGIDKANVLVSIIRTDGRVQENSEGRHDSNNYISQVNEPTYIAAQYNNRMHLVEALSSIPNNSLTLCQWLKGCGEVAFGQKVQRNFYWRSAIWNLEENQHINANPFTELAAALALGLMYDEAHGQWLDAGQYYSPQSMLQSVSQVSQLLGIDSAVGDVQTVIPADFTRLTELDLITNPALSKERVRYGALLAAFDYLADQYNQNNESKDFLTELTKQFLTDDAQFWQKTQSVKVFSLQDLYVTAISNLTELKKKYVTEVQLKALLTEVSNDLEDELSKQGEGLTDITPAPLADLLGKNDNKLYQQGLDEAKTMVRALNGSLLFEPEYQEKIEGFHEAIKTLSGDNAGNLDELILQLFDVQTISRLSVKAGKCQLPGNDVYKAAWATAPTCESYQDKALTLKANGNTITVNQQAVSGNAKATDVLVEGVFQADNLELKLKHKTAKVSASAEEEAKEQVVDFSFVRVFADDATSAPLGLQINWADFILQDTSTANSGNFKQEGSLFVFYRGVKDPEGDNLHYNVENLDINGTISNNKKDTATLAIKAKTLMANDYFDADNEFGSFTALEAFFKGDSNDAPTKIPELVSYEKGSEILSGDRPVDFVDVRIQDVKATRYRFYPEQKRDILDSSGRKIDYNYTFDMATCPISEQNGEWKVSATCSPKTRFQGKRDVQKIMNNLWRSGALSYITVPNQGEFFAKWPASTDANGCYNLDELSNNDTFDGEGLEAAVLGIDNLEMGSKIVLGEEKETTYVLTLKKPTHKRFEVTSALTHDGEKILISYNTNSAFKRTGGFSISRKGVNVGGSSNSTNNLDIGLQQEFSSLPHRLIIDAEGNNNVCITSNEPYKIQFDQNNAAYSLSYRNTVYGTIKKEGGEWQAIFNDGTALELMPNFESLFTFDSDKLPL